MNDRNKSLAASIGLIIGCVIWGASFYQMKDAMAYIQPLPFVAVRMFGGALIVGALALFLGKNLLSHLKEGFITGIFLSLILISQTVGLKLTSASNSGFITGMFIVTVPLFSLLMYKEKTSILKSIAIGVNLIGLWFLTGGLTYINAGDMWTIFTAIVCGIQIVISLSCSTGQGESLEPNMANFWRDIFNHVENRGIRIFAPETPTVSFSVLWGVSDDGMPYIKSVAWQGTNTGFDLSNIGSYTAEPKP